MYSVHQVIAQADSIETVGTKRKFWYRENGQRFLFKAEERGTGEDWAEKVVCELARLLGLPHVEYELADYPAGNLRGVICPNMAPPPSTLVMGNQLLGVLDKSYPKEIRKKFGVRKYTVEAVSHLVEILSPPADLSRVPLGINTALGIFTGYLLLDTLVANQDRHHQNWAALLFQEEDGAQPNSWKAVLRLGPTFDHGSSLARNLTDTDRAERMITKNANRTVDYFARRAVSEFYPVEGDKTLHVIEVFAAFAARAPVEARIWQQALGALSRVQMEEILAQVPSDRMSDITRRFTLELLLVNQNRLMSLPLP